MTNNPLDPMRMLQGSGALQPQSGAKPAVNKAGEQGADFSEVLKGGLSIRLMKVKKILIVQLRP